MTSGLSALNDSLPERVGSIHRRLQVEQVTKLQEEDPPESHQGTAFDKEVNRKKADDDPPGEQPKDK